VQRRLELSGCDLGLKLEVHDHEVGVVHRADDAVAADAGLFPADRVAVESGFQVSKSRISCSA
jgi:hypothetical protein